MVSLSLICFKTGLDVVGITWGVFQVQHVALSLKTDLVSGLSIGRYLDLHIVGSWALLLVFPTFF